MSRFIDDIYETTETPSPAEIEAIMHEARMMRAQALSHLFAEIRTALQGGVRRLPRFGISNLVTSR